MSEPTNLWNAAYEASPAGTDLISNGDDEIRDFKKDIRERHEREHVRNASDKELDGLHREGSARAYYDASEPTNRPDGTTLDSNDDGRLWYDSTNDILYVWTGTEWEEAVDTTRYVQTSGNQTIAGEKTFEDTVTFEDEVTFDAAFGKGRVPTNTIKGYSIPLGDIFDALAPSVPNIGDKLLASGALGNDAVTDNILIVSHVERTASDTITAHIIPVNDSGAGYIAYIRENETDEYRIALAW